MLRVEAAPTVQPEPLLNSTHFDVAQSPFDNVIQDIQVVKSNDGRQVTLLRNDTTARFSADDAKIVSLLIAGAQHHEPLPSTFLTTAVHGDNASKGDIEHYIQTNKKLGKKLARVGLCIQTIQQEGKDGTEQLHYRLGVVEEDVHGDSKEIEKRQVYDEVLIRYLLRLKIKKLNENGELRQRLAEKQATVLLLYYGEGLPTKAITGRLGKSERTIKERLFTGRSALEFELQAIKQQINAVMLPAFLIDQQRGRKSFQKLAEHREYFRAALANPHVQSALPFILTNNYQQKFDLYYRQGMSVSEVAQQLAIPKQNINKEMEVAGRRIAVIHTLFPPQPELVSPPNLGENIGAQIETGEGSSLDRQASLTRVDLSMLTRFLDRHDDVRYQLKLTEEEWAVIQMTFGQGSSRQEAYTLVVEDLEIPTGKIESIIGRFRQRARDLMQGYGLIEQAPKEENKLEQGVFTAQSVQGEDWIAGAVKLERETQEVTAVLEQATEIVRASTARQAEWEKERDEWISGQWLTLKYQHNDPDRAELIARDAQDKEVKKMAQEGMTAFPIFDERKWAEEQLKKLKERQNGTNK